MRNPPSRLVLLGHPVSHSLSPAFQNAAIRAAGFSTTYSALDVVPEKLIETVSSLRKESVAGNVTVPHKRAIFAMCDRHSELARRTGAVNTFFFQDGLMFGDNTDVGGFLHAVRVLLGKEPVDQSVVVFGAGGAAAAVLAAVETMPGSSALLVNRNLDRARTLAASFGSVAQVASDLDRALGGATLVVNATPVGLMDPGFRRDDNNVDAGIRGDDSNLGDAGIPFDPTRAPKSAALLDLVYRPGETALVRAARAAGMPAADGREMLLEQGALAFSQWFGCAPNKMVMRKALEDAIVPG